MASLAIVPKDRASKDRLGAYAQQRQPLSRTKSTTTATEPSTGGLGTTGKSKPGRARLSCAECRRLKLKCSRTWPCTMCERRGCGSSCPKGVNKGTDGKGSRPDADAQALHERVASLEAMLARLRDSNTHSTATAAAAAAAASLEPEMGSGSGSGETSPAPDSSNDDETMGETFGTLTFGNQGVIKYVGSLAGCAYLHESAVASDISQGGGASASANPAGAAGPNGAPSASGGSTGIPSQTSTQRRGDPASPALAPGARAVMQDESFDLRRMLPVWEGEGRKLTQAYWDYVNWIHQVIPRATFDNDYLMDAYDTTARPQHHKLACVFFVMALGVKFDIARPPFDPRAQELFLAGKACFDRVGLEDATLATVQALHLQGTYILNNKEDHGPEKFWPLLGSATKVAQSLGLHRDAEPFGLAMYDVEERRQVYWELLTYDRTQALSFGRPCATSNRHSDTKFPEADEPFLADQAGYHHAKHRLMHIAERVIDIQVQVGPIAYSAVTALDAELEGFWKGLPESLMCHVRVQDLPIDPSVHPHLVLQRFGIRLLISQVRMHLNRAFFAKALKLHPEAPSHSRYSASFFGLFESAQELVQIFKQTNQYNPAWISRWWFFRFHTLTAATCLAAIAIQAPTCAFAKPASHSLSIVIDLLKAAPMDHRDSEIIPMLLRLQRGAQQRGDSRVATAAAIPTGSGSVDLGVPKRKRDDEDYLPHLLVDHKARCVVRNTQVDSSNPTPAPLTNTMASNATYNDVLRIPAESTGSSERSTVHTSTDQRPLQSWVMPNIAPIIAHQGHAQNAPPAYLSAQNLTGSNNVMTSEQQAQWGGGQLSMSGTGADQPINTNTQQYEHDWFDIQAFLDDLGAEKWVAPDG